MINISERTIRPTIDPDLYPLGRGADIRIVRAGIGFVQADPNADPLPPIHYEFLDILHEMTPARYTTGTTFIRVMPAAATEVNETHRDKGNHTILNCVSLVAAGPSLQLEFFDDLDQYEEDPIVVANGRVITFGKTLHRRGARPAGTGPKVFLSANLHCDPDADPLA